MTKELSIQQIEAFHKNKKRINKTILIQIKRNDSVIFGGHALNAHLPPFLDRPTKDFDVFTKNPKKSASELEKKLDKQFGSDLFFTKPAIHPGTIKVMNRVTEGEVADFSKPKKQILIVKKTIDGKRIRIASLPFIKQGLKKILKDPESKFRHAKDRDALRRIRVAENLKKKRIMIAIRKQPRPIITSKILQSSSLNNILKTSMKRTRRVI